jgi:hypothetical protein
VHGGTSAAQKFVLGVSHMVKNCKFTKNCFVYPVSSAALSIHLDPPVLVRTRQLLSLPAMCVELAQLVDT